jgi:GNAT superfamily N-acetyltransferase
MEKSLPKYRPAQASDADTIVDFQIKMAWETEKIKLNPRICKAGVQAVFERPHLGTYYVCICDGAVVGSLLITSEWSDWRNGTVWWMQSVFLELPYRGRGFFSGFYSHIKKLVEADPAVRGIRLYVERSNDSAQAVYIKLGMNGEHYRLFEWMKP